MCALCGGPLPYGRGSERRWIWLDAGVIHGDAAWGIRALLEHGKARSLTVAVRKGVGSGWTRELDAAWGSCGGVLERGKARSLTVAALKNCVRISLGRWRVRIRETGVWGI